MCSVLLRLLLRKQGVQFLFKIMIVNAFVQFHAGLHGVYHIFLRAIAADRGVDVFCRFVHGAESA